MQRFVPGNRARCRDGHHAVAAHAAVRFVARDVIRKRLIHLTEIAFTGFHRNRRNAVAGHLFHRDRRAAVFKKLTVADDFSHPGAGRKAD